MIINNKKYQVVIIDNPIENLDDKKCADIFGKLLKMKHTGYKVTYGDNVLPMDKSDFFSTHILLCEVDNNNYTPIIAYKSTSYDKCLFYKMEFPALTLMKEDGTPKCVNRINNILQSANSPSEISFDSSWAQNLEYRYSDDQSLKIMLREITMMFAVKHHEYFKIPHMISCGVVKVKTDQFFYKIGLKELCSEAHFIQKSINNQEVVIFYNDSFSELALEMAKKYNTLWDDKLLILPKNPAALKIAS